MGNGTGADIGIPSGQIALLEGIPAEKRQAVLRCLNARTSRFSEGDLLASRASAASCTRCLVEGSARIIRYDAAGNRSILGDYGEGSVVGSDLTPLFFSENGIDIVATTPCTTLDFSISHEVEGCTCCVKYINRIKGNLVNSLAETNMQLVRRLDTLSCRSTRDKVLSFLQEQARIAGRRLFTIPYNRQELADYLCIERSALSRELGKMQREGIISFERSTFSLSEEYCPTGL